MRRRDFLRSSAAGLAGMAGAATLRQARAADGPVPAGHLISRTGSSRATGYAEANKIVTIGDRTHVCWLDSVEDGFRARVRTFDRAAMRWSDTVTLGDAYDNHGGPALTADSRGYLHTVYYPHHHPMRYRRSLHPNDGSQWSKELLIADKTTYPTLLCGPDDVLYLTCRVSDASGNWTVRLYRKPIDGPWAEPLPTPLIRSRYPKYAHFQDAMAWGPDGRTIHLSCRIYEQDGARQTVGYMRSDDGGTTWRKADGTKIELPATADTIDVLAGEFSRNPKPGLRCGAIAVDPRGSPLILHSRYDPLPGQAFVAGPDGKGGWFHRPVKPTLAATHAGYGLIMPGGLSSVGDRLFVALTLIKPQANDIHNIWGHPTSEPILLETRDGGETFVERFSTPPDAATPRWLPSIERNTGHHPVAPGRGPALLYTEGGRGDNNRQIVANRVYAVL